MTAEFIRRHLLDNTAASHEMMATISAEQFKDKNHSKPASMFAEPVITSFYVFKNPIGQLKKFIVIS